jgi:hypothetical protein
MPVRSMPMDEILNLKSGDFDGSALRDCLHLVDFNRYNDDFYGKLRARMQETKTNAVPIEVQDGWLYNGHHRVKIAADLGFTEMNVSDEFAFDFSGWRKVI